ncbi:MAG: PAS domain-containing protein [Beijerinckiaceae bacterium]
MIEKLWLRGRPIIKTIFENAPVGLGLWDLNMRYVRVNKHLAVINGISPEDHVGKHPSELLPDIEHLNEMLAQWKQVLETGETVTNFIIDGETPASAGSPRSWRASFFPVTEEGVAVGLAGIVEDVTESQRMQARLAVSDARLRLAQEIGRIGTWEVAIGSETVHWDGPMRELLNLPADVPASREAFLDAVCEEDRPEAREKTDAARREGTPYDAEFRVRLANGDFRWLKSKAETLGDEFGRSTRVVGVLYDITDQKQRQEELRLLMQEAHHRSNNLLAVILSIVGQSVTDPGVKPYANALYKRLMALSACQDLLVNEPTQSTDIDKLVESQLLHMGPEQRERVRLSGPALLIGPKVSQAIGLAIHELTTNAFKYGALSNGSGIVDVDWKVGGPEGQETFSMRWVESGGPPVREPTRRGFGYTVISRMAGSVTNGEVGLSYDPAGFAWQLKAPLAKLCL